MFPCMQIIIMATRNIKTLIYKVFFSLNRILENQVKRELFFPINIIVTVYTHAFLFISVPFSSLETTQQQ